VQELSTQSPESERGRGGLLWSWTEVRGAWDGRGREKAEKGGRVEKKSDMEWRTAKGGLRSLCKDNKSKT